MPKTKRMNMIVFLCLISVLPTIGAQERGLTIREIKDKSGTVVATFGPSYALVIGEGAYSGGWPVLPGVKDDVTAVKKLFEEQGFTVRTIEDAASTALFDGIAQFLKDYGYDRDNRLLVYFAGHGATRPLGGEGRDMGYIVPTDAPSYHADDVGFKRKAIPMQQFDTWARQVESRHVIFLFDSCFSGSIFATSRALPGIIDYKIANPVRQFISSGKADETVPDRSVFRRQLEAALRFGEGDANMDGYVSASELGDFLQTTVVNYSYGSQHPQYGKIRDPALDKGDFVFLAGQPPVTPSSTATQATIPAAAVPVPVVPAAVADLLVITTPAEAELFIDGARVGLAGDLIPNVAAGRLVTLEARKGNYYAKTSLTLKAGDLKDLNLVLDPLKGNLYLKAKGAENCVVTIDGRDLGAFGVGLFRDLEAGDCQIIIRGPGLLWQGTVAVAADKTTQADIVFTEIGGLDVRIPSDAQFRVLQSGRQLSSRQGGATIEDLPIGSYALEAYGSGYEAAAANINVSRSAVSRWEPWTTGSLTITTEPSGAEVYVDGRVVGRSPATARNLATGTVTVSAKSDGYQNTAKAATITAGRAAALSLVLSAWPKVPDDMVLVPAGSFQMGSTVGDSDEIPVHSVTLSAFCLGKYEVTQSLYQTVMGTNPSYFTGDISRPVENVTWYDAVEFCNKLSIREGWESVYTITGRTPSSGYPITSATVAADFAKQGYRLPTEAEWEYAARGATGTRGYTYAGSNTASDVAWYTDNSGPTTHAVGTKAANELGLYDMSGNVCEWCWDWCGVYGGSAQTNPVGPSSGESRVLRNGGWNNSAGSLRLTNRGSWVPVPYRSRMGGFRVLLPSPVSK